MSDDLIRKEKIQIDVGVLSSDSNPSECHHQTKIFTPEGIHCGRSEWTLFQNTDKLGDRYADSLDLIPHDRPWPLAIIEKLEINEQFRKQGNGRRGLQKMISAAKACGASCMILKVAWDLDEGPQEACQWRCRFYESEGFSLLERDEFDPFVMYKMFTVESISKLNWISK